MSDKEKARKGHTLEVMEAWQGTTLTSDAWELAKKRPWENEPSVSQITTHAQDSLAGLAQSSFAMGYHARAARSEASPWVPIAKRPPSDDWNGCVTYKFPGEGSYIGKAEYFAETPEDEACWVVLGVSDTAEVTAWLDIDPYTADSGKGWNQ